MAATRYVIRENQYFDSVFLMGINKKILSADGVIQSAVLMGTKNNKQLLADIDIKGSDIDSATANDLIVAVIAETNQLAEKTLGQFDEILAGSKSSSTEVELRTIDDGLRLKPQANLAVISVPGEFAAREAQRSLEKGLNVFLFSSNVRVEEELELKTFASDNGLIVMGPDCGTSIINGKGIGFANYIRNGSVGVIGPSGTGLQEFTCLIHHMGAGISHAIGTGSRDLKDEIGGITTFSSLNLLESDSQTEIVAIVSKPAGKKTLEKLLARLEKFNKPVVTCFLGVEQKHIKAGKNLSTASTIDEAAELTISLLNENEINIIPEFDNAKLEQEFSLLNNEQKYIRGLFAGGTFCYQSQQILQKAGFDLHSNEPLKNVKKLEDLEKSIGHTLIDMGDEYYTLGKPHPMIDGTMRSRRILNEAADPETAVILLDFILGFNSSHDPVGEVLDAILRSKRIAKEEKRNIAFIASITGTEEDGQDLNLQKKMLEDAGVLVTLSNASATKVCSELLRIRK